MEIKRRITLANRCYYDLNRQLSSRDLARTTKQILYKALILQILLYGTEAWIILGTDAAALRVFERKILRKIQCELAMISEFDLIVNYMSLSTTYMLCSALISKGSAGKAISFV